MSSRSAVRLLVAPLVIALCAGSAPTSAGTPQAPASCGSTPVAAGVVQNIDSRTMQAGSVYGTFTALDENCLQSRLRIRIQTSDAAGFVDATVSDIGAEQIVMSWTMYATRGIEDPSQWWSLYAGQLVLDTSRRTADQIFAWIRTTYRAAGNEWVEHQTGWSLLSLNSPAAIDSVVGVVTADRPTDVDSSGFIYRRDTGAEFARFSIFEDETGGVWRIYLTDAPGTRVDALDGGADDTQAFWESFASSGSSLYAGRIELPGGRTSDPSDGSWVLDQDCRSGTCEFTMAGTRIPIRLTFATAGPATPGAGPGRAADPCDVACASFCRSRGFQTGALNRSRAGLCLMGEMAAGVPEQACDCR